MLVWGKISQINEIALSLLPYFTRLSKGSLCLNFEKLGAFWLWIVFAFNTCVNTSVQSKKKIK